MEEVFAKRHSMIPEYEAGPDWEKTNDQNSLDESDQSDDGTLKENER